MNRTIYVANFLVRGMIGIFFLGFFLGIASALAVQDNTILGIIALVSFGLFCLFLEIANIYHDKHLRE